MNATPKPNPKGTMLSGFNGNSYLLLVLLALLLLLLLLAAGCCCLSHIFVVWSGVTSNGLSPNGWLP